MNEIIELEQVNRHGPQEGSGKLAFSPGDLARDEVDSLGEVRISVKVSKGDLAGEYVADGHVEYRVDLRCARCLEPFPFANRSEFTVRYRAHPDSGPADAEVEIAQEELDIEFYREPVISLRDLAYQQVQLSIPMKPLCAEDCRGLCVQCGMNLNRGSCECRESLVDDRWGALRGIAEDLKKKNQN